MSEQPPRSDNKTETNNNPLTGTLHASKETGTESIVVSQIILQGKTVFKNEIHVDVKFGTATFAVAAMLKGLEEFYFKPSGMKGDETTVQHTEHNLKVWEEVCQKAQSKIILP